MKKDFTILFSVNLVLRIIMQGLLPIFPIFISRFGVSKEHNGFIIAGAYLMLLFSTWLNGKLVPAFFNAKTLFCLSVFPLVAAIFLLGQAQSILEMISVLTILFFAAGFNITSNGILIGYFSRSETAGKNYGIIGMSNLFGSIFGGFIVGPVLFSMGYDKGFILFAIAFAVTGLSSFGIAKPSIQKTNNPVTFKITKGFASLLFASFLVTILIHFFLFTSSLLLSKQGYSIKDISIFSAIGMGIAFPSPYIMGWLTKRYAPISLILAIFLLTGIAVTILLLPISIPIYLIGIAFIGILSFSLRPVVMSLIFDWFDEKTLPMAQSYLGVGAWLAAIVGYLFTGMLLQRTGQTNTIIIGVVILITATIVLIFGVKKQVNAEQVEKPALDVH